MRCIFSSLNIYIADCIKSYILKVHLQRIFVHHIHTKKNCKWSFSAVLAHCNWKWKMENWQWLCRLCRLFQIISEGNTLIFNFQLSIFNLAFTPLNDHLHLVGASKKGAAYAAPFVLEKRLQHSFTNRVASQPIPTPSTTEVSTSVG